MRSQETPLISVIMGIYNCADTLPDAIESILNQTFQDFELILCNDGSTDKTLEIAQGYAVRFPERIVLIQNEQNMGLNFTLNHCLQIARGKYIARMDGDDRSLPNRFQVEATYLDEHPEYAFVSASLEVFDNKGVWGRTHFKPEPQPSDLVKGSSFSHSACMVRKSVFDEVGGYSEGKWLMRVEDKHLWYKIYMAGYRGRNLEEILYSYRDDRDGYNKRKLRYRFNSVYVASLTIKAFHLPPHYYLIAANAIVIGLLPYPIYNRLHKWKMNRSTGTSASDEGCRL